MSKRLRLPVSILVKSGLEYQEVQEAKKHFQAKFPFLKFFTTPSNRGGSDLRFIIKELDEFSEEERTYDPE
jgi:hypothetical protein